MVRLEKSPNQKAVGMRTSEAGEPEFPDKSLRVLG